MTRLDESREELIFKQDTVRRTKIRRKMKLKRNEFKTSQT